MIEVLDLITEQTWDERYWQLSLKADNPVESYQEITSKIQADKDAPKLEELPAEQQQWLRNVG